MLASINDHLQQNGYETTLVANKQPSTGAIDYIIIHHSQLTKTSIRVNECNIIVEFHQPYTDVAKVAHLSARINHSTITTAFNIDLNDPDALRKLEAQLATNDSITND